MNTTQTAAALQAVKDALAAGQAAAAQLGAYAALPESFLEIPDVQDESGINAYYSREVVLECIDAALASHGQAPAPADSVQEDAAREAIEKVLALFPFNALIQKFSVNNGPCLTADNDDEFYSVKRVLAFLTEIKTTLDAARKQGATK